MFMKEKGLENKDQRDMIAERNVILVTLNLLKYQEMSIVRAKGLEIFN